MKFTAITGPRWRGLLLGGTLLLGTGVTIAYAQGQFGPRDPASMPETRGKVMQYSLTPRGDVNGLILVDGTEIHFPPHLGTEVQAAVRPGDDVSVRGMKEGPLVMAGSVTGVGNGRTVVDKGPGVGAPPPRGPLGAAPPPASTAGAATPPPGVGMAGQAMEDTGVVKMQLHGPRGEVNGVLLQNGTILRLPPEEASRLADSLKPGSTVAARGFGAAGEAGRAIEVRQMGPDMGKLSQLAGPPAPFFRR